MHNSQSWARLATVPNTCDEDCIVRRENLIAHDVAASTEPNDDLANIAALGGLAEMRRGFEALECRPDRPDSAGSGLWISQLQKTANTFNVRKGLR